MAELRGRCLEVRSEKGAVPRLTLILEVKNDSEEQAPIMFVRGSIYVFSSTVRAYDIGHFLGQAVVSEGWSGPTSIAGKETKKWWARLEVSQEAVKFVERAREKGDLYLNVVLDALMLEVRDARPSTRWVSVRDYEDNSKNYVRVKIARSDWEKILGEITPPKPFFDALRRTVVGKVSGLVMDKAWSLGKKGIGYLTSR